MQFTTIYLLYFPPTVHNYILAENSKQNKIKYTIVSQLIMPWFHSLQLRANKKHLSLF